MPFAFNPITAQLDFYKAQKPWDKLEYWNIILAMIFNWYWDRQYQYVNIKKSADLFDKIWNIIRTEYFNCFWDIVEYTVSTTTEVVRHKAKRFADENALRDYVEVNCANNWLTYTNDIVAIAYDLIDGEVPQIFKVNFWNTLEQIFRWRNQDKKSYNTVRPLNLLRISSTLYAWFIEQAINTVIPERKAVNGDYVYDVNDNPNWVLWFPRNTLNKYSLLNDETIILPSANDRNTISDYWAGTVVFNDNDCVYSREVLHDESYYVAYNLNQLTNPASAFTWYTKHQIPGIVASMFEASITVMIAYKLHTVSAGVHYYAIQLHPVNFDSLYFNSFDEAKYNLECLVTQYRKSKKLRLPVYTSSQWAVQNAVRIEKINWITLQWALIKHYWTSWRNAKLQFFLRDRTTGKISKPSDVSVFYARARRDNPIAMDCR